MTKEFCDRYGIEMKNKVRIRISFLGSITRRFVSDNVLFCEVCFNNIESEIYKYLPARAETIV